MVNEIIYPDYENCLTNVACSILKHFNLPVTHKTIPYLDGILTKNEYKNILMIVYDGLGLEIIKKNLPNNTFFSKNIKHTITSVFPSTTASATTSLLSGLNPCEHGWVGYDIYFKEINKNVSIFSNKIKDTDIEAAPHNVANTYLSYENVIDRINNTAEYKAYSLFPFGKESYKNLEDMHEKIQQLCKLDGKKYIYAYYNEPDHTMHRNGTTGEITKPLIERLNNTTEKLIDNIDDTLVVILADHGHIDTKVVNLEIEYPDFVKLIDGNTSIEGRACAFWVKEENRKNFEMQFNQLFSKDFILLNKEEVLNKKIFGDGYQNKNFEASIGDYLAIGIGNKYFELHYYPDDMITHHAGITKDEMIIPLIIVETKKHTS